METLTDNHSPLTLPVRQSLLTMILQARPLIRWLWVKQVRPLVFGGLTEARPKMPILPKFLLKTELALPAMRPHSRIYSGTKAAQPLVRLWFPLRHPAQPAPKPVIDTLGHSALRLLFLKTAVSLLNLEAMFQHLLPA